MSLIPGFALIASSTTLVLGLVIGLATLGVVVALALVVPPWLTARMNGNPVGWQVIVGMRLRRTPPGLLLEAQSQLRERNINASLSRLEHVYLANRTRVLVARDLMHLVEQEPSSVDPVAGALAEIEQRLKDFPLSEAHRLAVVADMLVNQGTDDEPGFLSAAIRIYDQALEQDPKLTEAMIGRGRAFSYMDDDRRAIAEFTRAIQAEPQSKHGYFARAVSLKSLNRFDEALEDSNSVISIDSDYSSGYSLRAGIHEEREDLQAAIADYTRAIELEEAEDDEPDGLTSRYQRAMLYQNAGRHLEAIDDLSWCIENVGPESWYVSTRGESYFELGQFDEALRDLEHALAEDPDCPHLNRLRDEARQHVS